MSIFTYIFIILFITLAVCIPTYIHFHNNHDCMEELLVVYSGVIFIALATFMFCYTISGLGVYASYIDNEENIISSKYTIDDISKYDVAYDENGKLMHQLNSLTTELAYKDANGNIRYTNAKSIVHEDIDNSYVQAITVHSNNFLCPIKETYYFFHIKKEVADNS